MKKSSKSNNSEPPKKKSKGDQPQPKGPIKIGDLAETIRLNRLETAESIIDFDFKKKRVQVLSKAAEVPDKSKGIVYWMSRDARVQDNWAFLYAQKLALKNKISLHVCFCLVPKFLDATIRHFKFLLKGIIILIYQVIFTYC